MKFSRLIATMFLVVTLMAVLAPAAAQDIIPSAGCTAISDVILNADPSVSITGGDFDYGDVVSIIVSGPGDTYTFLVNGVAEGEGNVGDLIIYVIPETGAYDFSVEVSGGTSVDTTVTVDCTPVSEAGGKIEICHIPPGNPNNAHTIRIALPAVLAHMAHGDTIGRCPEERESGTEDATIGVTAYIFIDDLTIEIFGNCGQEDGEGECELLLIIDLSLLEAVDDGEWWFEPDDDVDFYVVFFYLGPSHLDENFGVFQLNLYRGDDVLMQDDILIFMDADGVIVGWDLKKKNLKRDELPDWFYGDD
jgi:hypothetical protein